MLGVAISGIGPNLQVINKQNHVFQVLQNCRTAVLNQEADVEDVRLPRRNNTFSWRQDDDVNGAISGFACSIGFFTFHILVFAYFRS